MEDESSYPEFVKVISYQDARLHVIDYINRLEHSITALSRGGLHIVYDNHAHSLTIRDARRVLIEQPVDDPVQLQVRNILIEAVEISESRAASAGLITLIGAIHFIRDNSSALDNRSDTDSVIRQLCKTSKRTDASGLEEVLMSNMGTGTALDMVKIATQLAGLSGQVLVNRKPTVNTGITLVHGYKFPIVIDEGFLKQNDLSIWREKNVKILIIDGIIERESEIHRTLIEASKNKVPMILVTRGYSDEVSVTLSENFKRRSLNVLPVVVPIDMKGINMMNDIAAVCDSDVVSALKGELISHVVWDDIPTVDSVILDDKSISVTNKKSKTRVRRHIKNLIKKRDANSSLTRSEETKTSELIDERLSRLNTLTSILSINANDLKISHGIELDKIAVGLRLVKEISRFGIISLDGLGDITLSSVHRTVLEKIKRLSSVIHSSIAVDMGLRSADTCARLIKSIGAHVISD